MNRRPRRSFPLQARSVLPAILAALGIVGMIAGAVSAKGPSVPVLTATGVVDNVFSGYLSEGIARAARNGAPAVIIRLNTPGGALGATNDIVSAELESTIPVIVWVSPSGGFAASAGTFITLASNLAYMEPGTRIGAASPIDSSGNDIPGTLGQKVKNDAIAAIKSIAETRHRNVDWAVQTVDVAKSSPASEAVSVGAVDGIASSLDEVRQMVQGKVVEVAGGRQVTIDLTDVAFDEQAMNPFQSLLHLLSDPNIALLLFTVGFYGLIYEVINPNFVTGIIGALSIILALIGFGSLPLNLGGLALIILAMILFGLEVTVTSHGLLAVGGIACFVLGASALYTEPGTPTAPDVSVGVPLIVVMTITTAAFVGLIVVGAVRSRHYLATPGTVGTSVAIGTIGQARVPIGPLGSVYAAGEEWTARSADSKPIPRGETVRVVGMDGLTLIVEPDPTATLPLPPTAVLPSDDQPAGRPPAPNPPPATNPSSPPVQPAP